MSNLIISDRSIQPLEVSMVFNDLIFSRKSLTKDKLNLRSLKGKFQQDTIKAPGEPSGSKTTPGPQRHEGHSWWRWGSKIYG